MRSPSRTTASPPRSRNPRRFAMPRTLSPARGPNPPSPPPAGPPAAPAPPSPAHPSGDGARLHGGGAGQPHREAAARARRGLDVDGAAEQAHVPVDDREAEAHAAALAIDRASALMEGLEDLRQLLAGDAGPRVDDPE